MILTLDVNHRQLDDLHKALDSGENKIGQAYSDDGDNGYFASIMSVKARTQLRRSPIPEYTVELEVQERYGKDTPVPLEKLSRVLQALNLFP